MGVIAACVVNFTEWRSRLPILLFVFIFFFFSREIKLNSVLTENHLLVIWAVFFPVGLLSRCSRQFVWSKCRSRCGTGKQKSTVCAKFLNKMHWTALSMLERAQCRILIQRTLWIMGWVRSGSFCQSTFLFEPLTVNFQWKHLHVTKRHRISIHFFESFAYSEIHWI